MRTLLLSTVLVAVSVAGLPLAALDSAAAAPAECQGRTATIVSDGGTVTGTDGDDVVSTTGTVVIEALSGNDIICMSLANGGGSVDGGDGTDSLQLLGPYTDTETWIVDLAGVVSRGVVQAATHELIEEYSLDFGPTVAVQLHGTAEADVVEVAGGNYDGHLGGSDDRLQAGGYNAFGMIDGGPGTDELWSNEAFRVHVVLGSEGVVAMGGQTINLKRFEDATVDADLIEVDGSPGVNTFDLRGCRVKVHGNGGDDVVRLGAYSECTRRNTRLYGGGGDDLLVGGPRGDKLKGGPGADRLLGRQGVDTLVGGAGPDEAVGGKGRDACEAEVRASCEMTV